MARRKTKKPAAKRTKKPARRTVKSKAKSKARKAPKRKPRPEPAPKEGVIASALHAIADTAKETISLHKRLGGHQNFED